MDQLYKDVTFVDYVTSRVLDKTLAIEARTKVIQYFKAKGVCTKTCREPGMKIIATKWLDVNKGDETTVDIGARLVGARSLTRSETTPSRPHRRWGRCEW